MSEISILQKELLLQQAEYRRLQSTATSSMIVPVDMSKCKDRAEIAVHRPDVAHMQWQPAVLTYRI